jgi:hypothetical protein
VGTGETCAERTPPLRNEKDESMEGLRMTEPLRDPGREEAGEAGGSTRTAPGISSGRMGRDGRGEAQSKSVPFSREVKDSDIR